MVSEALAHMIEIGFTAKFPRVLPILLTAAIIQCAVTNCQC